MDDARLHKRFSLALDYIFKYIYYKDFTKLNEEISNLNRFFNPKVLSLNGDDVLKLKRILVSLINLEVNSYFNFKIFNRAFGCFAGHILNSNLREDKDLTRLIQILSKKIEDLKKTKLS